MGSINKKIPPGLRMPKVGRHINLTSWNRNKTVLPERSLFIFEWCPTGGQKQHLNNRFFRSFSLT